jgi:tetratricopeptide (TPR) repeat protein
MAAALWPLAEGSVAGNNLRQRLFRLRRHAGTPLVEGVAHLRLSTDLEIDIHRPSDFGLDDELLAGHDYLDLDQLSEWVDDLRLRWQSTRLAQFEQQSDQLEGQGQLADALDLAKALLRAQPSSEHAYQRVMRLHYLRGDRARALATFDACRERLRADLGVSPGAQTVSLERLIRKMDLPLAPGAMRSASAFALKRPPRLVGRDQDLQVLAALRSRCRVTLLSGEPGIGKSRLAEAFADAHGPCIRVKAGPTDQHTTYGLLTKLVRAMRVVRHRVDTATAAYMAHLDDGWGRVPAGPMTSNGLRTAWNALMRIAAEHWSTLLIDDLQWVDAATLDVLLPWMAGEDGFDAIGPPVLLVSRQLTLPPVLSHWIDGVQPGTLGVHVLGPLSRQGVADLLDSMVEMLAFDDVDKKAGHLYRQVGGHPLMLLELLLASTGPAARATEAEATPPPVLADMVHRRAATLAPEALRLLRVACLAGPAFTVSLASLVLGMPALALMRDWEQLERAHFFGPDGLPHDLIAQVVAAAMPRPIVRELHAGLARATLAAGVRTSVVAAHWDAAGRWQEAGLAFEQVAAEAKALGRPAEEAAAWLAAARCHDLAGDVHASWRAGVASLMPAMACTPFDELVQRMSGLYERAPDDLRRAEVLLLACRLHLNRSDGVAALPKADEACRLLATEPGSVMALQALTWRGLALVLSNDVAGGLAVLRKAREAECAVDDLRLRIDLFGALAWALHAVGDFEAATQACEVALESAVAAGAYKDMVEQSTNMLVVVGSLGDRNRALAAGERALTMWRRAGEPDGDDEPFLHVQLATHLYGDGRFGEALHWLDWALPRLRRTGSSVWAVICEHRLATVYLRLGQRALALATLTTLPTTASAGARIARAELLSHLLDDNSTALRGLQEAEAQWAPKADRLDQWSLDLRQAALESAEVGLARLDRLLADVDPAQQVAVCLHAWIRRADLLVQLRKWPEAAESLRAAWTARARGHPLNMDWLAWHELVVRVAAACNEDHIWHVGLQEAQELFDRTLPNVPAAYRGTFCLRDPRVQGMRAAPEQA